MVAELTWMWPAVDRFLTDGFGIAACADEHIAGWCTAEYASATRSDIGIEIVNACAGHGFATETAARFVTLALAWEYDNRNLSSVRMAEKAGFVKVLKTPVWVCRSPGV